MIKINRLAVFCGSSQGIKQDYTDATRAFAQTLCENNIGLVYGGANVGLMKVLADTMMQYNGDVIGVIPQLLVEKEIAHEEIAELHVVDTMHERKNRIAELAEGFVLLPGSVGSLDEFFEMLTWNQLGIHQKPCAILNTLNYYDPLLNFLDQAIQEGFLKSVHKEMIIIEQSPAKLIEAMNRYQVPSLEKWIKKVPEHA